MKNDSTFISDGRTGWPSVRVRASAKPVTNWVPEVFSFAFLFCQGFRLCLAYGGQDGGPARIVVSTMTSLVKTSISNFSNLRNSNAFLTPLNAQPNGLDRG